MGQGQPSSLPNGDGWSLDRHCRPLRRRLGRRALARPRLDVILVDATADVLWSGLAPGGHDRPPMGPRHDETRTRPDKGRGMTSSVTFKDYKGKDPIWCPGCGDFGVLTALQKAAA